MDFTESQPVYRRSMVTARSCYRRVVPSSAHTGLFWGAREEAELGPIPL